MLRQKKPNLQAAVQECRAAVEQLHATAPKALLYAVDFQRVAKFCKRLGPLIDEVEDASGLEPEAEQQGVQAFKGVTAALQQLTTFAAKCSSIGPLYALLQNVALAQQLTNCNIDLCNALEAVNAPSLHVSLDLQEDLVQHVRQLQRTIGCTYNEQQHMTLLELYVQAEAVRSGKSDASALSAILTQQVLQQCTVAQLVSDVAYLQQAAQEQQHLQNHVGAAFYQQLATICKALLPADAASPESLLPTLQCTTDKSAQETAPVPASSLLAVLAQPHSSISDKLQAVLTLAVSLAADATMLPPEVADVVAAADVPKAATCDILQALAEPAAVKACIKVVAAAPMSDAQQDAVVKQATLYALDRASAMDSAVAAGLVSCEGCLAALAKLVTAGKSASSAPDAVKVFTLQLLCTLSSNRLDPTAHAATATPADADVRHTTSTAAKQLVEQHKVIPPLIQLLSEVKVVKGKALVGVVQRPRTPSSPVKQFGRNAAAAAGMAAPSTTAGGKAGGRSPAVNAAATPGGRASGRMTEAVRGKAVESVPAPTVPLVAAPTTSSPAGHVAVMHKALQLLQVLAGDYKAAMQAAGVMPALADLLFSTEVATAAALQLEAVKLLVLLLEQDKDASVEAIKNEMLSALALLIEQCACSNSSLLGVVNLALLRLLKPPVKAAQGTAAVEGRGAVAGVKTAQHASAAPTAASKAQTQTQPAKPAAHQHAAVDSQADLGMWSVEAQMELGRCFSPTSVAAGMQLLAIGAALDADVTLQLLGVLRSATAGQEAKAAAFAHTAGMEALLKLATAAPTPVWVCNEADAAAAAGVAAGASSSSSGGSCTAAAAAALLQCIGQEQQIKPHVAQPLAQVVLHGSEIQRVSAAWLVAGIAACRADTDKLAIRAAGEFCKQLAAAGAAAPILEVLRSSNTEHKAAAVAAVRSLAAYGDTSLQASLIAGGAAPLLVDVVRSTPADHPLAAAATAALGALAASAVQAAGAAVCDLLLACLQPSSATVAANAAEVALKMAGAYPETASLLINAGALPKCLKLLQDCSTGSNAMEACSGAARLLAWLLRGSSANNSNSSEESSTSQNSRPASNSSPTKSGNCATAGSIATANRGHTAGNIAVVDSGASSRHDVPSNAVAVLLAALRVRDDGVRLPAAAAMGQLLRWPTESAFREAAAASHAATDLLDVICSTAQLTPAQNAGVAAADWAWVDAAAGLAAFGALHSAACTELAHGLRQLVLRGSAKDAGSAATVASWFASSPKGRAALLSEGVLPGLVSVVGNPACSAAARAAAADAIGAIAVPSSVVLDSLGSPGSDTTNLSTPKATAVRGSGSALKSPVRRHSQQQQQMAPDARIVDPKLEAVRAGAAAALVGLLRAGAGPECVLEAAESLYILAGCQAGRDAAVAAGAREALQDIVLAGKRREVGDKVAKAAYDALMRFL